jgi:hypothetical protein
MVGVERDPAQLLRVQGTPRDRLQVPGREVAARRQGLELTDGLLLDGGSDVVVALVERADLLDLHGGDLFIHAAADEFLELLPAAGVPPVPDGCGPTTRAAWRLPSPKLSSAPPCAR